MSVWVTSIPRSNIVDVSTIVSSKGMVDVREVSISTWDSDLESCMLVGVGKATE